MSGCNLLQEDGDDLLQEDGSFILIEDCIPDADTTSEDWLVRFRRRRSR